PDMTWRGCRGYGRRAPAWGKGISTAVALPARPSSDELHGNAAERAQVAMQGIALLGEHHAGEGAGEHQVPGPQGDPVGGDLVRRPGDTECRMAEHAGGDPSLLDLGVTVHDAANPAQVDLHRPDRATAHGDAGGGAVVRDGVEDFARVLEAGIDDLERRH